ncbi:MAG: ankyrin repeat domain-containing protein [Planctomycetes bacterium]|nr:ankyrin repeat domain-containing protein [Planctomycetota bacterium]
MPTRLVSTLLLCALGGMPRAQDPPFPLPKPAPDRPTPDDAEAAARARRLCEAIDAGKAAVVTEALLAGTSPDTGMGAGADSTAGRTPLIHAVVARRPELVDLLLAHGARFELGDDAGHTPLMYAARIGDADAIRRLVRLGARPDAQDDDQQEAREHAPDDATRVVVQTARDHHATLLQALAQNDLAAARQAIAAGASPNGNDGVRSALGHAVRTGSVEACQELLQAGARPGLMLVDGWSVTSPLAIAAKSGSLAVLRTLLAAAPDVWALGHALCTAADAADDRLQRVELLLAAGAPADHEAGLQTPALAVAAGHGDLPVMAKLLAAGAPQSHADHALLRAAGIADAATAAGCVRALLAAGANASAPVLFQTALAAACARGHRDVAELLFERSDAATRNLAVGELAGEGPIDELKWLLARGGKDLDLDAGCTLRGAPLLEAIDHANHAAIKALLEAGADPNLPPTILSDAPLVRAVRRQDEPSIHRLLEHGADAWRKWEVPLRPPQSALDVANEIGYLGVVVLLESHAPPGDADLPPLGRALRRAGLHNDDIGGVWQLRYTDSATNRSQLVYLRKAVTTHGDLAGQEIYSLVYDAAEPPPNELVRSLFQQRFGLGGLVLEAATEQQPNWRIRFRYVAPTTLTPADLAEYLDIVQSTADQLERTANPGAEDRL